MEFIVYLAYYGLIVVVGILAFILILAAVGNAMAKNRKERSQAVLDKSGRNDIRIQK